MKFHFGAFLLLICLIVSCKSKDPVIKPDGAGCNLIKFSDNGENIDFTFSGNKIKEAYTYTRLGELFSKKVVVYDAKGYPIRINEYNKGGELRSYWEFTVDDKGRIITANLFEKTISSGQFEKYQRNSYEYNDEGLISKLITAPNTYIRYVYDSNGNIIQYFIKSPGIEQEYLGYDAAYDTKLSPTNRNLLYSYLFSNIYMSVNAANNPIRERYYYYLGEMYKNCSYSYQYDEKGYPTERILTDSTYSVIRTLKASYNYDCQ